MLMIRFYISKDYDSPNKLPIFARVVFLQSKKLANFLQLDFQLQLCYLNEIDKKRYLLIHYCLLLNGSVKSILIMTIK